MGKESPNQVGRHQSHWIYCKWRRKKDSNFV